MIGRGRARLSALMLMTATTAAAAQPGFDDADFDLNGTYRALVSYLGPQQRVRLRDEERAWIAARDRRCGAGSHGACATAATRQRTAMLQHRIDGFTVGVFPKIGSCTTTRFAAIGPRLEGAPDSGTHADYRNGTAQVDYDPIPGIVASRVGDPVRLCVVSLPTACPKGDYRGIFYAGTNLRTGAKWRAADSQHLCGGA